MIRDMLTIARKELARFFSSKVSAAIAIVLPGLLIYGMWSIMGVALTDMMSVDEDEPITISAVNLPEVVAVVAEGTQFEFIDYGSLPPADEMKGLIEEGAVLAFAVFPEGFEEAVASYNPATQASAPQVEVYFDSSDTASYNAYSSFALLLDAFESSMSNRFDINAGEESYDLSDKRDRAAMVMVSIVPMVLLVLLFSGCMSIAAESVAGEKERGTLATLLATPIRRSDIALGKVLALSLIGLAMALSSTIGIFASLPNLTQGGLDISVYGPGDYALLALVIASTTLLIIAVMTIVSAIAKSTKEAQLFLTPLMVIVIAIGLVGMFGGEAASDTWLYLIPFYNSMQCMIAIFMFEMSAANCILCIASNLVYTIAGIVVLQRMFRSEKLMFSH